MVLRHPLVRCPDRGHDRLPVAPVQRQVVGGPFALESQAEHIAGWLQDQHDRPAPSVGEDRRAAFALEFSRDGGYDRPPVKCPSRGPIAVTRPGPSADATATAAVESQCPSERLRGAGSRM